MTKISVIIPVYNTEQYLCDCLDSILNQSFKEIDVIVVNDGSTDSSGEILLEYAQKDNRVTVLDGGHNGAPKARQMGLEIAQGEYCLFFDSDDYMLPGALEMIVNSINGEDLLMGNFVVTKDGECFRKKTVGKYGILNTNNPDDLWSLMINTWANPINKIIKREWIINHGIEWYDSAVAQDLNYYQKILAIIDKVKIIEYDLGVHRYSPPNGITSNRSRKILDSIKSLYDVERFAINNNASENYLNYLKTVKLINYNTQIKKCKDMKYKDAKKVGGTILKAAALCKDDLNNEKNRMELSMIKWAHSRYCSLLRFVYFPYLKIKSILFNKKNNS